MKSRSIFGVDLLLVLTSIMLVIIGILFIYSSGITSTGINVSREYIKQIFWLVMGLSVAFFLAFFDYNRLMGFTPYLYVLFILLLVITLQFGKVVNGAKSWLGFWSLGIQPSEFTKIVTILYLAQFLSRHKRSISQLLTLFRALMIVMVPMLLILVQPDMGTALVFLPVFFFMTFIAGARVHYLVFIFLVGVLSVFFAVSPVWYRMIGGEIPIYIQIISNFKLFLLISLGLVTIFGISLVGVFIFKERKFYWLAYLMLIIQTSLIGSQLIQRVLKEYQIMRLIVFMDPEIDRLGAGWNIIQSVTAVGSGGLWGKGYLKGTQSHYRFLPQQSTDFIFSILSEEWGLIGGIFVFILISVILFRGLIIAYKSQNTFGGLVAAGIVGMIFFHAMINIGMTIGVMPITGIPLMFLSYGGSSLLTGFISIGLLLSIHNRRYRY